MTDLSYYTDYELSTELTERKLAGNCEYLDMLDRRMLREIIETFHKENWEGREKIYKNICKNGKSNRDSRTSGI